MIGKHNLHSDGNQCCRYILTQKDNDRIELIGVRNSPTKDPYETAAWMEKRKGMSRADYAVYHVQLSPDHDAAKTMTDADVEKAIAIYCRKFEWQDRTAIWAKHYKNGFMHVHGEVSRWNPKTGKMDPYKMWARDSRAASKEIEKELGHKPTRSEDPRHPKVEEIMTAAWYSTKTELQFKQVIAAHGFVLCHGKGRYYVVDVQGTGYPLARKIDGAKTEDLKKRFGNPFLLPKLEDTTKRNKAKFEAVAKAAAIETLIDDGEMRRKKLKEQMQAARQKGRGR